MAKKTKEDRPPFFPGRKVEDEGFDELGVEVEVFPLGFRHIKEFAQNIAGAFQVISGANLSASKEEIGKDVMARLIPYAMTNLLDLIEKCTKLNSVDRLIDFGELPHYLLPPIIEGWIEENFGEEKKWRPWVAAINRVVTKMSGKDFSISETFSSYSSPQDIPDKTSLTTSS